LPVFGKTVHEMKSQDENGTRGKKKWKKRGDETTDPNWYSEAFHPITFGFAFTCTFFIAASYSSLNQKFCQNKMLQNLAN
jgi:hypothetical protein